MLEFNIERQECFSRGQLLLRSFFGWLYIMIPHGFLLFFLAFAACVLQFIAWWAVLFTVRYPKNFFNFQVNLMRWSMRVNARMYNLIDGYPAFGMKKTDPEIVLNVPYPEKLSRIHLLFRTFFGILYCIIPHYLLLFFRTIATCFFIFLAWWVVLFTGKYPVFWHNFNVGTLRWSLRVGIYMGFLSDKYPPFSAKP